GIELVNRGRWPRWLDAGHQAMKEPYPDAQVAALLALLAQLRVALPALRHIAGHEDLDTARVAAEDDPSVMVARTRDPGPLFPWPRVLAAAGLERIPSPSPRRAGRARRNRIIRPRSRHARHGPARLRTDRTAVARAPGGQPVPRPEPRHRHQVRVRWPGAGPGAVRGPGHPAAAAPGAFAARLLPARRRHRASDRLRRRPHPRRRQLLGAPGDRDPARQGDLLLRGLVPGAGGRGRTPAADAAGARPGRHRANRAAAARGARYPAEQGPALAQPRRRTVR